MEKKPIKRTGVRDKQGYLLMADGTRNPYSVKNLNTWKRRMGEA